FFSALPLRSLRLCGKNRAHILQPQRRRGRRGSAEKKSEYMNTLSPEHLRGVFAVPPLARRNDARRSIDVDQNERIVKHIVSGGISRLLYGGNAFLYHATLSEFESLLEWLSGLSDHLWMIPSIGPSFGRALEQAELLSKHSIEIAMMLPCGDPRDAAGVEKGYR